MKKIVLLALLVQFSQLFAATIEKTYFFEHPQLTEHNGFQLLTFDNTLQSARGGQPSLPWQQISLLLPPGEEAINVTIEYQQFVSLGTGVQLFPHQSSRPLSDDRPVIFQKDESLYQSTASYPETKTGQLVTAYLNGFAFALSSFTPVQYVPATGDLSYATQVTVRIETQTTHNNKSVVNTWMTPAVTSKIQKLAQNPEAIGLYAGKSRTVAGYELLIVTTESYIPAFDDLVAFYLERGIRTQLVSVETIGTNGTGDDVQEKIRNYIIDAYNTDGIENVLLGGDVNLVPYRGFYCYVQSGSGYEDNGIPADLYYAALDGNWNDNGDNKWGEPGEDDLLPEIGVARMPFGNVTELQHMIHKTTQYQSAPVLGELTSPLLAGENLYSGPDTWGRDYLELLIGERDDNGYTTIGIPEDYNIQTMYEYDAPWSGSTLIAAINQGKQFVHHVGHASQTYVAHLNISDITDANFAPTNGIDHNYTILHTHGCDCGSFDYNDCILEKMVTIQNFAVAVVGNSRYGWFNEGQTEGPAAHLHREMTDAFYHDHIAAIGPAMTEAKIQTAPWVTAPGQWEEGALRWNFYDLNILGDPAMNVWVAEPISPDVTYQPELLIGMPETNVQVELAGQPLTGYRCAMMMNGELVALGFTDENGEANLVFDPAVTEVGDATLIVSGQNMLAMQLPVSFIPNEGAYVVYDTYVINDAAGNNNGMADYNEAILLGVGLENVGLDDASDLTLHLSCEETQWVNIANAEAFVAFVGAGQTAFVEDAFAFVLADYVPNQTALHFTMSVTDANSNSWTSGFVINALAPSLRLTHYVIDDNAGGNGNGLPDAGETLQFHVFGINEGGSDALETQLTTNTNNPEWITVVDGMQEIGLLEAGAEFETTIAMQVNDNTPVGSIVPINCMLSAGNYEAMQSWLLSVGLQIEDFETGDMTAFEWQHGGNADWTMSSEAPYEGSWCAKSGVIGDGELTELKINVMVMQDSPISFYRKVSSEQNYDFLRFYMDDTKLGEWSGELPWGIENIMINEGYHTLRWVYEKDYSLSTGADMAWVDYIVFPAASAVLDVAEGAQLQSLALYPNPNKGMFTVNAPNGMEEAILKVYNATGQIVFTNICNNPSMKLDLSFLERGLYLIALENGQQRAVSRFLKQ